MSSPLPKADYEEEIQREADLLRMELCTDKGSVEFVYNWGDDVWERLASIYKIIALDINDEAEVGKKLCSLLRNEMRSAAKWKVDND